MVSCNYHAINIMQLSDIEGALKGQFIFKQRRRRQDETEAEFTLKISRVRPLYTDEWREKFECLAFMVFIEVALERRYDEDHIIEYLGINKKQYAICRREFSKNMDRALKIRESGLKLDPESKWGKVYNKTNLVRNRLRFAVL